MMRIENECVCCDLPCINCGRKHVEVYYCDECDLELGEERYRYNGCDYCLDCFVKQAIEDVIKKFPETKEIQKFLIEYFLNQCEWSEFEDFLNRTGIKYEVVQ